MQAQVPSGSARDAVSIPREFNNQFANFKSKNEKRKSSKNESLIHRCYFGLNRQGIAAIKITTITELSTIFSYHVAIIAIVTIKWKPGLTDTFANKVHCLIKFVWAKFGPSLCGRCSPPRFFCGNPTMVGPRSITTLCWPIWPYFSAHLLYCQYIILSLLPGAYLGYFGNNAQMDTRGVQGHAPPRKLFRFRVPKVPFPGFLTQSVEQ